MISIKEWLHINKCAIFNRFKMTYSQSGEDTIIVFLLQAILRKKSITYMDVGCNHPYTLNNTALLREYFDIKRGVLVEPNPDMCRLLQKKRKKDICLNIGLGTENGVLDYYMLSNNTINTFSKEEAMKIEKSGNERIIEVRKVEIRKVSEILEQYFQIDGLDVLSIDVEGIDFLLLQAVDYSKIRPSIICVETIEFCGGKDKEFQEMIQFMKKNEYFVYADTWLNTIFVDKKIIPENYLSNYLLK